MQVPGLVATLLQAVGSSEAERAAGAWHAEWPALNQLLRATGSAVHWVGASLERLHVEPSRMAANLARSQEASR
jgi:3-carboxy-cis,cis-muconate cycloisomerase